MANLFERSILLTIGVAAVAREVAESLAGDLVKIGEATTEDGRQAVNDTVEKAKEEARTLRSRFDSQVKRGYSDMGIASNDRLDEMQLKIAQLEHRVALLEAALESLAGPDEAEPVAEEASAG